MSDNVLIKVETNRYYLHLWFIFRIFETLLITQKNMFQLRPYGKAELALLYHPYSTPDTAMKTLYRWIKGCSPLMAELSSMNYNPKRHTFLKPEVEAIVKHLGEP